MPAVAVPTAASIGIYVIAAFFALLALRFVISAGIRDARLSAKSRHSIADAAEEMRRLRPLEERKQRCVDDRRKAREHATETRAKLPVWGKYNEPTEEVLAYARRCLKNEEGKIIRAWRVIESGTAGNLSEIAIYYFLFDMAHEELAIARAHLEVARVSAKEAKVRGYKRREARKDKRRAKKAVAFLTARYEASAWEVRKRVNLDIIMHDERCALGRDAGQWNGIRWDLAQRRALEETGPAPVIPKPPKHFDHALQWSTTELGDYVYSRWW